LWGDIVLKITIPVFHVTNTAAAEAFYATLGFHADSEDSDKSDPRFVAVERDGVSLHLSSHSGDGVVGSVAYVVVEDVDVLHAELASKGVQIDTGPVDQTWGVREMYVKDGDGNCLRFATPIFEDK
jgi:catechol 2,3-dioxygenase-like lactoylglutathione lyase family enzyme